MCMICIVVTKTFRAEFLYMTQQSSSTVHTPGYTTHGTSVYLITTSVRHNRAELGSGTHINNSVTGLCWPSLEPRIGSV